MWQPVTSYTLVTLEILSFLLFMSLCGPFHAESGQAWCDQWNTEVMVCESQSQVIKGISALVLDHLIWRNAMRTLKSMWRGTKVPDWEPRASSQLEASISWPAMLVSHLGSEYHQSTDAMWSIDELFHQVWPFDWLIRIIGAYCHSELSKFWGGLLHSNR